MAKVKILKVGGQLGKKKAATGASLVPLSSDIAKFKGPSHAKGGIPFKYGNTKVEVEGEETLKQNRDGSADVLSKTTWVPGTNKTFANVSELLAKKEAKVTKLLQKGTDLVNTANTDNKWELLKFNSGKAMMGGSQRKLGEIQQNKDHLVELQRSLLEYTDEMGVDPVKLTRQGIHSPVAPSEDAKCGKKMKKAQMGISVGGAKGSLKSLMGNLTVSNSDKPSIAKRNNNPGNIMFGEFARKFGAVQGDPRTDGQPGYFAKFPDVTAGLKAMSGLLTGPSYKNLTVEQASKRWVYGDPNSPNPAYGTIPNELRGVKISALTPEQLTQVTSAWTMGEDSKDYNSTPVSKHPSPPSTSGGSRIRGGAGNIGTGTKTVPYTVPTINQEGTTPSLYKAPEMAPVNFNNPSTINMKSNAEPLEWNQILPELYTAATNKQEPVVMQKYGPQLYQPYQVSFQDRLNDNTAQVKGLEKLMANNPEALSTLAGQQYQANSGVLGEEFRTNQAIANDITNKNISLLNDAQNKNLALADQQYVRQSTAKSITKAQNFNVLDSISNKLLQRTADNRTLQVYENMYPYYRFDPVTGKSVYGGPNANELINFDKTPTQGGFKPISTRVDEATDPKTGEVLKRSSSTTYRKMGGSLVKSFNSKKKAGSKTMGAEHWMNSY